MAQTYTRQSSFADGDTVTAALFNDEYNQLVNAFTYSSSNASSTGHRHDGTAGQGGNIHTIGDLDFLNKIVADSTNNRWGIFVEVSSAAVEQIRIQDGAIVPVTDNDIDLGTSSLEFKDAYFDGTVTSDAFAGPLTGDVTGNVSGTAATVTTAAQSNITSLGTLTTLTVDNVIVNGTTIGHTSDTDLLTLTSGVLTVAGELDAATLDISGDADIDGTTNLDIVDIDGAVDMATTLAVAGNVDFNGNLDVDGTTNLDVVDIDGAVDMATTLAVAGNVDFNGDLDVDGTTNLDVVDIDGAVDMASTLAVAGVLTGASLDISGDIDIDGTSNLDVVDIDGAVDMATTLTVGGEITAASLDISGNVDIDGTLEADAVTVNGVTLAETISDTVGAMVSSNTETNITVTYEDSDNTLDFVIGTLNQDTTGLAATATALATARTIHGVSFDGTANIDLTEVVQDTVGAMVSSNTESGITVAYQDGDGTLDFTVGTLNQDTTGTAATVTTAAQPNITSLGTLTTLTVDNVIINGSTIGHTGDTDLITVASGVVTVAGELDATSLDISGDADIDGTLEADAITIGGVTLAETISDTVGAMVTSNTESGITVAYQDADNTLDFTIGTLNQDTTGTAATVTTAAQPNITSLGTLTTLTVDDITINGSTISDGADLTLDVEGDIILDANGGDIRFKDAGTAVAVFENDSLDFKIVNSTQDKDIIFRGNDGGSGIDALTLDMSDAGTASFNHDIKLPDSGKAIFGAGSDLQIFHDGSHSFINDTGTGDLSIKASNNLKLMSGASETYATFTADGAAVIYHDNSAKLTTTSTGATTTGLHTSTQSANITQVAITSSSNAVAWDARAAANAYHVTTENTTFSAPSNAVEGAIISVELAQGGTARTVAWNTVFEFAASTAPTVTATANKTDIFSFRYNGSVWQEIGRVQNMAQT